MSVTKRVSGDYTVATVTPNNNINLTTHTVYINGNLAVQGNTMFTSNSTVSSNFLVLNDGLDPNIAPVLNSGITVTRGVEPDVSLRWNEEYRVWQVTLDGEIYYDIITTDSAASVTALENDPAPKLGGNLDVGPHTLWSSFLSTENTDDSHVRIDSNLAIKTYTVSPVVLPGYTTITSSEVAAGGTGLYVNNDTIENQELVSKRRALIYALIL